MKQPKTAFKLERHRANDAILELQFDKWFYAGGYRDAAESLARKAGRFKDLASVQRMIYPTLFLYRHYLELALKSIIDLGAAKYGGSGAPRTHNLMMLWARAKPYILRRWPDRTKSIDMAWAEELIQEFARIDKNSEDFRYPSRIPKTFVNPNRLIDSVRTRSVLLMVAALTLKSEAEKSATH